MGKCLFCDQEAGFVIKNGYIAKSRPKRFCSHSCSSKFRHQNFPWIFKKERKNIICPECHILFPELSEKNWNKRKFCSRSCSAKHSLHKTLGHSRNKKKRRHYKQIKIGNKWVDEHRYIMENNLGRKLSRNEHVHHKDGNHLNNSPENLVVLSNSDHQFYEVFLRRLGVL